MITKRRYIYLSVLVLITIILSSCSEYNKILKSQDTELIYNSAIEHYNKESYIKALQLFDKIIVMAKGTDKEEPLSFYYAKCYYNQGDYLLANYYFRKYHQKFYRHERAEEAFFMAALCKYNESSMYSLDPTPTTEAIAELQSFIDMYPESEKIAECNQYIDILRDKLELKDYKIATMYFKMEEYKAAIVSFENILKDFPDTDRKEEIYFNLIKSKYYYADQSIHKKRKERYEDVVNFFYKFETTYPDSEYYAKAKYYYELAKEKI